MQIVIEIDDKLYKKLQNEKKLSLGLTHIGMKLLDAPPLSSDNQLYNNIVDIGWAIKDGILLPEHHGRLIDADELLKRHLDADYDCRITRAGIDNAPTIIEAESEDKP